MDPAARATDRARLSEIEEEIQRFETHLAALRIERTKIRERLENYSYPVLSLPNEIVTEIFVHYLPPYPDFPPLIGPGSPTYLLGICRLWRSVALHSPMLWRSIELDCEIYRERMGVAQTWLKRSGGVLLSLNLDFGLSRETLEEDSESLLQVVLASRSRWEYIQLVVLPAHIPLISGPVPALVQIDISTRRLEESEADAILFYDSQRLHSVCLWNVEFDAASIPCGHLTSLTLINTRPSPCMAILQTATNLTRCKLYMLPSDTEVESCHILLPRLEILVLVLIGTDHHISLTAFILPSLRKLEISDLLFGVDPVDRLQAFISRSNCRLECLRIVSFQPTEALAAAVDASRIAFPYVTVGTRPWQLSLASNDNQWKTVEYWDPMDTASESFDDGQEDLESSEEEI